MAHGPIQGATLDMAHGPIQGATLGGAYGPIQWDGQVRLWAHPRSHVGRGLRAHPMLWPGTAVGPIQKLNGMGPSPTQEGTLAGAKAPSKGSLWGWAVGAFNGIAMYVAEPHPRWI